MTGGNLSQAIHDYEAATRLFMTKTIEKTKETIPGCKVGWYGYPRNNLPLPISITDSISWKNWCSWHEDVTSPTAQEGYPDGYPDGRTCWFEDSGYADPAAAAAQRSINDGLGWLFEIVDFITPSVYLGYEGHSPEDAETYVRNTVEEARRLADEAGSRTGLPRPEVAPQTWARYNDQQAPRIRNYVSAEDARIQHVVPLQSGADKIIMWGSVDDEAANENDRPAALQTWLETTFTSLDPGDTSSDCTTSPTSDSVEPSSMPSAEQAPTPPTPTPPTPTPQCNVGDSVKCPGDNGAWCAGNQCCPGSVSCPSASNSFSGCAHPKTVDCTLPPVTSTPSSEPSVGLPPVTSCDDVKEIYRSSQCCAQPDQSLELSISFPAGNAVVDPTCGDLKGLLQQQSCCSTASRRRRSQPLQVVWCDASNCSTIAGRR